MIQLLPKWNLHNKRPSFYDTDSVTMLELAAKLHGAMNEVIEAYNELEENINKQTGDFITETNQDREVFASALRQEFQDFIDIINLKLLDVQGPRGYSAYEIAVRNGFNGSEAEWLESLKGDDGYDLAVQNGFVGSPQEWLDSLNGDSAYEVAVQNGFVGTEREWLQSLLPKRGIDYWTEEDKQELITGVLESLPYAEKELF